MQLRREVSLIFGYTIPDEADWETVFKQLNRDGRINQRKVIELITLLLKREEARENTR